jgi:amino acid transporter
MPAFLLLILVSIFACGVASMAATTRLLFALARDNMLPASGLLSRIHPAHRTPRNAIVAIWCLTLATVVALENFGTLDIITSIATICGYLGYGGIALASLTRFQGPGFPAGFRLGRWRNVVAGTAVAWTLVVVFALTLPAETTQHPLAPLLATATTLAIGAILYATVAAGRIARGLAGPPPAISEAHEAQLERTPGLEKEAV